MDLCLAPSSKSGQNTLCASQPKKKNCAETALGKFEMQVKEQSRQYSLSNLICVSFDFSRLCYINFNRQAICPYILINKMFDLKSLFEGFYVICHNQEESVVTE